MHEANPTLYKLARTPNGRNLWTYMAAILEVTRMDQGAAYPLKKFLGNFKTHLDSRRIVSVAGGFQLTPAGIDYFHDRYSHGSSQHIERAEVEVMIRGMTTGFGPDEWVEVV